MNKTPLLLITFIIACLLGLTLLSQHSIHDKITADENAVKQLNVIQDLIDSTNNKDSVFNSSLLQKTVVLNVSIPFMRSSKVQLPGLNKLASDFRNNKNVVFIALLPIDSNAHLDPSILLTNYKIVHSKRIFRVFFNSKLFENVRLNPMPVNIVFSKGGKIGISYLGDKPAAPDSIRQYLSTVK